jgi:hypothetical protein
MKAPAHFAEMKYVTAASRQAIAANAMIPKTSSDMELVNPGLDGRPSLIHVHGGAGFRRAAIRRTRPSSRAWRQKRA